MVIVNKKIIFENRQINRKGFSLMEMIIAIFVFSLIMVAVVGTFVSVVSVRNKVKAVQQDIENARFSMEQMSKTLRTSSVLSFSPATNPTNIKIFDYSQGVCIEYQYSGVKLQSRIGTKTSADGESPTCTFSGSYVDIINGSLAGASFKVIPSASSPSPIYGRITMALKVCYNNICTGKTGNNMTIQTTVSLRDYQEVNP